MIDRKLYKVEDPNPMDVRTSSKVSAERQAAISEYWNKYGQIHNLLSLLFP